MRPVAVKAPFWVSESFSAGRAKSEIPARTRPHFMTGALLFLNGHGLVFVRVASLSESFFGAISLVVVVVACSVALNFRRAECSSKKKHTRSAPS